MAKRVAYAPTRAARELIQRLKGLADPARAESYQRYFKEPVAILGVANPTMKELRAELDAATEDWTLDHAVTFCKEMVKDPHLESRGTGFQTVARFVGEADADLLPVIKRWLETACGNWGLVDNLVPSVLSPLLGRLTGLIPEVCGWTQDECLWVRRASAVAFVSLVKEKRHLPAAYRIARALHGDGEDLIQKAVGWMLREAGKTDRARLQKYLLKHGPKIPRTTVRYAIEKFPKEERKRLLTATKG